MKLLNLLILPTAAMNTWQWKNSPLPPTSPISHSITINAPPETDLWRPSRDAHTFTAPFLYARIPVTSFRSGQATVRARWKTLYDQGGLALWFPSSSGGEAEARWIKAGIEFTHGEAHLGVVATDILSDWSLHSLPSPPSPLPAGAGAEGGEELEATLLIERNGTDAWVYALEGGVKRPLRQVTWAFARTGEVHVGIYAAKPTREAGSDEGVSVTFSGVAVDTVDGPVC